MTARVAAEYGQSHRGDPARAVRQVQVAADAGAWSYKTQALTPALIAHEASPVYWDDPGGAASQRAAFTRAGVLDYGDLARVAEACQSHGVALTVSPFDPAALHAVVACGGVCETWVKIASGEATHWPFVAQVARVADRVAVSLGACTPDEAAAVVDMLRGVPHLIVEACTLEYPTPVEHVDLARIGDVRRLVAGTDAVVGWSDHCGLPEVAFAAAASGAGVLEVHCHDGGVDAGTVPDDTFALGPAQLARYVDAAAAGGAAWQTTQTGGGWEDRARVGARRGLYTAAAVPAGAVIDPWEVRWLRPCPPGAYPPRRFWVDAGARAVVDIPAGALLTEANTAGMR